MHGDGTQPSLSGGEALRGEAEGRLLREATERARDLLQHNHDLLRKIAEELLEHETLDRAALAKLLADHPVAKAGIDRQPNPLTHHTPPSAEVH